MTERHAKVPIGQIALLDLLDRGALLVWLAIAAHANRHGIAFPSVQTISRVAGRSERTAFDAIDRLIGMGMLERIQRGGGRGNPTVYKVKYTAAQDSRDSDKRNAAVHGCRDTVVENGAEAALKNCSPAQKTVRPSARNSAAQDCSLTDQHSNNSNKLHAQRRPLNERDAEVMHQLIEIGVDATAAERLAERQDTTPELVQAILEYAPRDPKNLPGFVRDLIEHPNKRREEIRLRAHELRAARNASEAYKHFQLLSPEKQAAWLEVARQRYPNLARVQPENAAMKGALSQTRHLMTNGDDAGQLSPSKGLVDS